jgi:hypothetical protein
LQTAGLLALRALLEVQAPREHLAPRALPWRQHLEQQQRLEAASRLAQWLQQVAGAWTRPDRGDSDACEQLPALHCSAFMSDRPQL